MPYILNCFYVLLLLFASPWLAWQAVTKRKYREGFCEKILGQVPRRTPGASKCLWLHGVSVGEINVLEPLIKAITQKHPDWQCVISTTTMTGMATARKKYPDLTVFYCPLDFSWAVRRAMQRIMPDMLLLGELEIWPNLIRAAHEIGAKVAVVNGRLSEHSFSGYKRIRRLLRGIMHQLDLVAVQNETYAGRFHCLGTSGANIHITGSIKFDGACSDRSNPETVSLRSLAGIGDDDIVFLAGSTQEPEESLAVDAFRQLSTRYPKLRLIIVPRHPHRFDQVAKLLDDSQLPWQRRSELKPSPEAENERRSDRSGATDLCRSRRPETVSVGSCLRENKNNENIPEDRPANDGSTGDGTENNTPSDETFDKNDQQHAQPAAIPRILLVDTIGELGAWWGTCHIGYVGGSMGSRGGQNMIEPAAYGAAVSFGPNTSNFRDVVALMLQNDAAEVVRDGAEMTRFVERCLVDQDYAHRLGANAASLVYEQQGAVARTAALIEKQLLPPCTNGISNSAINGNK